MGLVTVRYVIHNSDIQCPILALVTHKFHMALSNICSPSKHNTQYPTLHQQSTYHKQVGSRLSPCHTLVFSYAEAGQTEYGIPHTDHLEESKPRFENKTVKIL